MEVQRSLIDGEHVFVDVSAHHLYTVVLARDAIVYSWGEGERPRPYLNVEDAAGWGTTAETTVSR